MTKSGRWLDPRVWSSEARLKLCTERRGPCLAFGSREQMRFSGDTAGPGEEKPVKEEEPRGDWGNDVRGPRGVLGAKRRKVTLQAHPGAVLHAAGRGVVSLRHRADLVLS